jgi:TPR repeat protein
VRICDKNPDFALAQFALGRLYSLPISHKNEVEAVQWYRRAAEQGHAAAQYYLGLCYEKGLGVDSYMVRTIRMRVGWVYRCIRAQFGGFL